MEDLKNLSAEAVMAPFVGRDTLTNRELFQQLAQQLDIPEAALDARAPVGKAGKAYNLFERKVRWHQQTLKHLGVLERVERGTWRLSGDAKKELTPAPRRAVLLAFSTDLGCAPTEGAIARNVLSIPHRDHDQQPARDYAAAHGLPAHPALMPSRLAEHFVRFLSDMGDLIVDPFGGWATTGRGAELHGRRWLVTERCREYLMAAAQRFRGAPGFYTPMESTYA